MKAIAHRRHWKIERAVAAVVEAMEPRQLLSVSFNVTQYDVGTNPNDVAFGDMNNDGKLDLVVANQNSLTIGVLLGDGAGGFGAQTTFTTANNQNPGSLELADINNDGNLDVVSTVYNGRISAMLGNGDGTLGAGTYVFVANSALGDLKLADVNADGKLDAVTVVNDTAGTIAMSYGDGTGGFAAPVSLTVESSPNDLALGDIDGNGTPDAVTANRGSGSVSFMKIPAFNRADVDVSDFPTGVALGDIDGDSDLDAVAVSAVLNTKAVSVMKNNGSGSFSNATKYSVDSLPSKVELGDVDDDGDLDILVSSGSTDDVEILLNNGSGTFNANENVPVSITASHITVGDLNGDGLDDFVTAGYTENKLSVAINTSTPDDDGGGGGDDDGEPQITNTISNVSLPTVFVGGDKGSVQLTIGNTGDGAAKGAVTETLYLSLDGEVDDSDILLDTGTSLANKNINVAPGRTAKLTGKFTVPADIASGNYFILADISSTDIGETEGDDNTAVTSTTYEATTDFGTLDDRSGVKGVTDADGDGTVLTMTVSGPGRVSRVVNGDGLLDVTLDGSTNRTTLKLATSGGDKVFEIGSITVNGAIKTIDGASVNLNGDVTVANDVSQIKLNDIADQHFLDLGGTTAVTLLFGAVTETTLESTAGIKSLTVDSWTDDGLFPDTITAPYIGNLTSKGDFAPAVTLSGAGAPGGKTLKQAKITGSVSGVVWDITGNTGNISIGGTVADGFIADITGTVGNVTIAGDLFGQLVGANIGVVKITGNMTGGLIMAGTTFGADNTLGGGDDTYVAGKIKSVTVGGAMTTAYFFAGVTADTSDLTNNLSNFRLDGGSIGTIKVTGVMSDDSRFNSAKLPKTAKVGGVTVTTNEDDRFPQGVAT